MTKEEISQTVEIWKDRLWLVQWEIRISFVRLSNDKSAAECDSHPEYMEADIRFAIDKLDSVDERVVVHELCHIIGSYLFCAAWKLVESEDANTFLSHQYEITASHLERIMTMAYGKKEE